ncbi:probable mitochondrial glutathione transporter SLC25A40 isoform X1 [Hemiscyllium ocellatum]|uniref:probable mitochondrial glutathione transporter SLC25A40 isoform X1 n=1 Tax=Hemiscyllium ocellatum TaxID=170820 RepID=UPI00296670F6|nr:probable mitochondrial glutathione transporter SLC25A40 isoform X1 [Hemiscyllium ocellatum]XP_060680949.1 probable mitochondrial glutathione transporter SLC25A40 isoform X1 [Hemiscyllium ocellatum]
MAVRQSDLGTNGITPIQQMIASCSGAFMTSLIVTPFDVVKIRLQAQRTPFYKGKCFVYCNGLMDHLCVCENGNNAAWYKAPGQFKGTFDAFIQIVRNEGPKSLWSGLPPTLVMAVPATVIYFTCYDQLRVFLKNKLEYDGAYIPLIAGALARVGAVTVISPLELIRTKSQSRKLTYRELGSVVKIAVAQDGWLSLWRGWGPTVLRDVPFSAIYWFNYELMKSQLCKKYNKNEPTLTISFSSGATSGAIAAVLTLPFDVVKTRRQIELGELNTMRSQKTLTATWKIMERIVTESGFGGLFVGLLPRLMKVAPACAIMISSYEYGKSFFRKINRERELKGDLQSDIS